MKHILNVIKNEIFEQNSSIDDLIKKVSISQQSYMKDRGNEALFNIWNENMKELQKTEQNLWYLKSAYSTLCTACEVEPQTIEEIMAEKTAKKAKKASKKNESKTEESK